MRPQEIKPRRDTGTVLDSAQVVRVLRSGQRRVPVKRKGLLSPRTLRAFFVRIFSR